MSIPNVEQDVPSGFYDLDDILAIDNNVTCHFDRKTPLDVFPLFGMRRPDAIGDKGLKAEVPMWLVPSLQTACTVGMPKSYNTAVQNVLQANAATANLERMQQHYYAVGMHLCGVIGAEARPLSHCLLETITQRIGGVVNNALQGHAKPTRCDELEKGVFAEGAETGRLMREWLACTQPHQTHKRKLRPHNE